MQLTRFEEKVFRPTFYYMSVFVGKDYGMSAETKKSLEDFKAFHSIVSSGCLTFYS
jgi:hypothetical protein